MKAAPGRKLSLLVSLYFCEGLPFAVVVAMPVVYLKNCGFDNTHITLWTSLLALPWSLKGLWATYLDRAVDLKKWIVATELIICLLLGLLAAGVLNNCHHQLMLLIFGLCGFVAATQDLAIDTYYLSNFTVAEQSNFMWLRNTAFRIAYLLGAGVLISLAGYASELHWLSGSKTSGWTLTFIIAALLMVAATLFNRHKLKATPPSAVGNDSQKHNPATALIPALQAFFQINGIYKIIAYVLVFRIGDAFLSAIAQPFLLDATSAGGLGLRTSTVGLLYGTIGAISLMLGGIIGGLAIARFGARRLLIPFSLLQSLSLLGYFYLALARPCLDAVCIINFVEQFTFGLTTACYSVVLLCAVAPAYRATHFALICAVMNFGLIIPGMAAGALSDRLGYCGFFLLTFILSLAGPVVSLALPEHAALARGGEAPASPA